MKVALDIREVLETAKVIPCQEYKDLIQNPEASFAKEVLIISCTNIGSHELLAGLRTIQWDGTIQQIQGPFDDHPPTPGVFDSQLRDSRVSLPEFLQFACTKPANEDFTYQKLMVIARPSSELIDITEQLSTFKDLLISKLTKPIPLQIAPLDFD